MGQADTATDAAGLQQGGSADNDGGTSGDYVGGDFNTGLENSSSDEGNG